MTVKDLKPTNVWSIFDEITKVPRPSGKLDKIRQWLVDFAKEHNFEHKVDAVGNVAMFRPAAPGYENAKKVVLQGHMDMVAEKVPTSHHNFETDPIETVVDGEWVRANGTTLGADDGMGVATIMAVMEDKTLRHGPIEGFITVDEETTMYGVNHMEPGTLTGDILLNLDNETEGEMVIGSAGGVNLTATMEFSTAAPDATDAAVKVSLSGLRGGHSGLEINEGRANANKLMARIAADAVSEYEACLASWEGGNMRNAIPRDCDLVFTLPSENVEAFKEAVDEWRQIFTDEYAGIEPALALTCTDEKLPATIVPAEVQDNLINALMGCHNGVMRYIPAIPEIVETSSNLAIVSIAEGKAMFKVLIRSSRDSMRDCCADTLTATFAMAGMSVELDGAYPAWQPNPASQIVGIMEGIYKDLFGTDNKVQVVHAGLECGLIGAMYPQMDMVSFGPTLRSPHTPDERCHIPSVDKYYRFVVATLENIPEK